jgi:hypothetical protein
MNKSKVTDIYEFEGGKQKERKRSVHIEETRDDGIKRATSSRKAKIET